MFVGLFGLFITTDKIYTTNKYITSQKGIWWGDVKSIGKEKWKLIFVQGKTGLRPFMNDNKTVFPIHYTGLFRFDILASRVLAISLIIACTESWYQFLFHYRDSFFSIPVCRQTWGYTDHHMMLRIEELVHLWYLIKMSFCITFSKKGCFSLKEREIKHSARPFRVKRAIVNARRHNQKSHRFYKR